LPNEAAAVLAFATSTNREEEEDWKLFPK